MGHPGRGRSYPGPRMRSTAPALTLAILVAVSACSSTGGTPATSAPAGNSSSTTTTTRPSPTSVPVTTTGPATGDGPAARPDTGLPSGSPGAPGLGDPYFPGIGNGGYDVEHYLLDLTVDPVENLLDGLVTIEATATQDLSAFNLDVVGLLVSDVSVDGAGAAFVLGDEELTITPAAVVPSGEGFSVAVTYSGRPQPIFLESADIEMGWYHTGSGIYVAAEPISARTWFPSNDHPADKASFTFRITVPEPYQAVATGRLAATTSDGTLTTSVWEMEAPMATYLASIGVGRYRRFERSGPDGILLRDYAPADYLGDLPPAFGAVEEMIPFLEERFGPFPFDTYGHLIVDGFPTALENQTLSLFGRFLLRDPDLEFFVVHELAHMWFGDSVTPAGWNDIWLNEGFATFAEYLWIGHRFGEDSMIRDIRGDHAFLRSVRHDPPGDPGVAGLFGTGVYIRGGLTLHALRAEVGDEAFFEALRTYADRFRHANASTADFIAVVEETAGRDLTGFFEAWLYAETVPDLP